MATVFSTATLGLQVDTKQFNKALTESESITVKALKDMQLQADAFDKRWGDLTRGIKDTKRIVSGILISQGFYALMNAMTSSTAAALEFSSAMEQASVSLQYFVDSAVGTEEAAAKVTAYLREVNEFAARTPFNTDEVLSLSKYMQSVGVAMGQTQSVLSVLTDAAAATGATSENLERITFALGQMLTKGRIANEEIRQLANANIPIYDILRDELGLTGEQISNIGKYWIDADKAVVAILNGLEKRYQGAADRIADTFAGLTDTIIDDAKIISKEVFSGLYDSLVGATANLRDTLDEWRDLVINKGVPGLFNDISLEIDPSGYLGNQILAIIGNILQLKDAFIDLYHSAAPLLDVLGKSLNASVNVGLIALTALAKTADEVITALDRLGITSTEVGQAIASLYVAYKATQFVSILGQALSSAAITGYEAASSIAALLPASIAANTGVVALTASVATLISYLLMAVGIFGVLNNSFAGLSSENSSSGLNNNWQTAYDEYLAQLEEYNAAVDAYRARYQESYKNMGNPDEVNIKPTDNATGSGSSGSTNLEKEWVAAFDEVYDIPDDTDPVSGGTVDDILEDFNDLIDLLEANFPFPSSIDLPEMPTFDLGDVYGDSIWDDKNASGADFWRKLLPIGISGLVMGIGKAFAKQQVKEPRFGDTTPDAKTKVDAFSSTDELSKSIDNLAKSLDEKLKALAETNEALDKALRKQQLVGNTDAADEVRRLNTKATAQLEAVNKVYGQLETLSAYNNSVTPLTTEVKQLGESITVLQKDALRLEARNIQQTLQSGNLVQGEFDALKARLALVNKQLAALNGGSVSVDLSTKTFEELGDELSRRANDVRDSFKSAFTGALDDSVEGMRGFFLTRIKQADESYRAFVDVANAYKARSAELGIELDTFGVQFMRQFDQQQTSINKALANISEYGMARNAAGKAIKQAKDTGLGDGAVLVQGKLAKNIEDQYNVLSDIAKAMDKLNPEALAEAQARMFQTAATRAIESGMRQVDETFTAIDTNVEAARKAADEIRRSAALNAVNLQASALRIQADIENIDVRSVADVQLEIRTTLKNISDYEKSIAWATERRTHILDATEGSISATDQKALDALWEEIDSTSIRLRESRYTLEQLKRELDTVLGRSSVADLLTLPEQSRGTLIAFKNFTDALDEAVPHLHALDEGVAAARETLNLQLPTNLDAALKALNMHADQLVATGTKFLTLANGVDAFTNSIPALVTGVFSDVLKTSSLDSVTSAFAKATAALGTSLEPLMRFALAVEFERNATGIVGGTGHAAVAGKPIIIQNDASVQLLKGLNQTVNGAVATMDSIGVDFKVTSDRVINAITANVVSELNGIKVVNASALLAANRPAWYYEFIPHLEAFGTKMEMLSLLNRDFDFNEFGSTLMQRYDALMTAGNSRHDLVRGLEGRYLSTEAVDAYRLLRGSLVAGLDTDQLTQLYLEEVIRPLFTQSDGLFDTGAFSKMMTQVIVDYTGVATEEVTNLAKYFYTMNEATALLLANKQLPADLSAAYIGVMRDGVETFSELDFSPVMRSYNNFSRSISGWFEQILGDGVLKGVNTRGLFSGAPVRKQIDDLVRTYNQAVKSGTDAVEAAAAFRDGMVKISETARMLSRSTAVPAELEGAFLKAGTDITEYGQALGKLADATEQLARMPSLVSELPRTVRTVVDTAERLNVQMANGVAISRADIATLNRNYTRMVEMLHLETDKAAYETGQQIAKLNELLKASGDETRVLSAAEAFSIDLPVRVANIKEHLDIWGAKVVDDLDSGLIKLTDDAAQELRAMLAGLTGRLDYKPLADTLSSALLSRNQPMSFVDIEAGGFAIPTAAGSVQPRPVQISAINPEGIQRSWYVNWGEDNKALLDYMRGISDDFSKAFSDVTVEMLDSAKSIDDVLREVYEFTGAAYTRISGYNASNIGGYDLDILNAWAPDELMFLPGPDVMRMFNEEVNRFITFGRDIKLTEAYEIAVGNLTDVAHLADNDISNTFRLWQAIQNGTVARIAETAANLTEINGTLNKLQVAAELVRTENIASAADAAVTEVATAVETANSIRYALDELEPAAAAVIRNTLGLRIPEIEKTLTKVNTDISKLADVVNDLSNPESVQRITDAVALLSRQRDELAETLDLLRQQQRIAYAAELSPFLREQMVNNTTDAIRKVGGARFFDQILSVDQTGTVNIGDFSYKAGTYDEALSYAENYMRKLMGLADDTGAVAEKVANAVDNAAEAAEKTSDSLFRSAYTWDMIRTQLATSDIGGLTGDLVEDAKRIYLAGDIFSNAVDEISDDFLKRVYDASDEAIANFRRLVADDAGTMADLIARGFDEAIDSKTLADVISGITGRARELGRRAYDDFFQYFNLGFSQRFDRHAIKALDEAINDFGTVYADMQRAALKADDALKAYKAVPDQTSDLAKSLKQAAQEANADFKAATNAVDFAQTKFFESLIVNTREGLNSARDLDFDAFGKLLSNGSDKIAYYIDKTTGEWKIIGDTITTNGEGLLKGYAKLAEAGTFGKKVAKEVREAVQQLSDAVKSGDGLHIAMQNLSDTVKNSFNDFQRGAVIYDKFDDVYYAGEYASEQVRKTATALDSSYESLGSKLLNFQIASFSILDILDIVITGFRQKAQDAENINYAGIYVDSLLSDSVRGAIEQAGLDTGELVASNIYDGALQASAESLVVNGVVNLLMTAIGTVLGGIPGLVVGALSAVGTSVGASALFGTDESSRAIGTWSGILGNKNAGGFFGIGAAEPYDTTAFEKLLRESGAYTDKEIADLVVAGRITDTNKLIDALRESNNSPLTFEDLNKVAELARTNSVYQAFNFATTTPTDNIRGNAAYENIIFGSGYSKDMYVNASGGKYGFLDLINTDVVRSLTNLQRTQGSEQDAAVRIAAALGLANVTSIAQQHTGSAGMGDLVSSEMVVPVESAANDLAVIKQVLGEQAAGYRLGATVNANGQTFYRVLDETGKAVRYFGDDIESLRSMIGGIYYMGAQGGDFTKTITDLINNNAYLRNNMASSFGVDQRAIDAYNNLDEYISLLASQDSSYRDLGSTVDQNPGMAMQLMQQQLDIWETYEKSLIAEAGVNAALMRLVGGNTDALNGNTAQYVMGANLAGTLPSQLEALSRLGITLDQGQVQYSSPLQDTVRTDYMTVSTDQEALLAALRGITVDVSGVTVDLDGQTLDVGALSVTASEAAILAEAGIQINGDGTVSFMYNNNEERTGNERNISLSQEHFSQAVLDQLGEYNIKLNFDTQELEFSNFNVVKEKMTAAMFKLSDSVGIQTSDRITDTLKSLGEITSDGFFKITNDAVLRGETSMTEALDKLDWYGVSDVVRNQFYNIAALVDQEGGSVQDNLIEWANAVVIPSPIKEEDLTNEMRTALRNIGIAFTGEGEKLQMIISNTGEKLTDGFSLVDKDKWDSLTTETLKALDELGVKTIDAGNQYIIDLTGVMNKGVGDIVAMFVDKPDMWNQLPDTVKAYLEQCGITAGEQLLKISSKLGTWLVETSDGWIASWEALDEPTRKALRVLAGDVDTGTYELKELMELADIPGSTYEHMVIPFEELDEEYQKALRDAGYEVEQGGILLKGNIEDADLPETVKQEAVVPFENLPPELQQLLGGASTTVNTGMLSIVGYLEDADIPETVDKEALVPFSKLPVEMQDALKRADENCEHKLYDIKNTASTGFTNLSSVLGTVAGAVADTADGMATTIANAVSRAMQSMQQLEQLQKNAGRSGGGIFGIGSTKNNVTYVGMDSTGTYFAEYTSAGTLVRYIKKDARTGVETTIKELPQLATGGIASGLTLTGELGRELAIFPDGSIKMLGEHGAELGDLPAGTRILNNEDTEDVLKYTGGLSKLDKYADGNVVLGASDEINYTEKIYELLSITLTEINDCMTTASFMPESAEGLRAALDLANGGVVLPGHAHGTQHETANLIDAVTRGVLERVLPAIATAQQGVEEADGRTPIYVGTLVANDAGLRELERKLYVIRQAETMRRG